MLTEILWESTASAADSSFFAHQSFTEPKFAGGDAEWRKFLERNLNRDLPVENGAEPGVYTPMISFLVDTTGSIGDIKIERNPGYGTVVELIRVIKLSPKWISATKNGKKVAARKSIHVVIEIGEE